MPIIIIFYKNVKSGEEQDLHEMNNDSLSEYAKYEELESRMWKNGNYDDKSWLISAEPHI